MEDETMNIQVKPNTLTALASNGETPVPVSVAYGDGIGPEIMEASLRVLQAAGANIAIDQIEIGEQVYLAGNTSGIGPEVWDSLRRTKVLYKAPITTPQGGGYKSLNVTIRKSLGLFANVRPATSYAPFIATKHPGMALVIIRENEEDLYAGIEHRQTDDVYQCLKLISLPGCERIVRYAFEYARVHGRRKVSCFTKDNIMKLTDGLFHSVFDEVAAEYPDIEHEHLIVDIGAALLADTPGAFDFVVMPNLYGDILSDVAAQITGSVGLAPSANIGEHGAMFEAIHGSAPRLAGKGVANPSGLILAGAMMLDHISQPDIAARIRNAWLATIEDGIHTEDIFKFGTSRQRTGTAGFADAVIARLGQQPGRIKPVSAANRAVAVPAAPQPKPAAKKELVGVDVFVHARTSPDALAAQLNAVPPGQLKLSMITNRGVKVWPAGQPETFCTDHWRCRFLVPEAATTRPSAVVALLDALARAQIDFIKTEQLYTFDSVPGFSLGQGQ
jgi:isocitrate dehydrogenase